MDLQTQIQTTQEQITDYKTNPAYKYEQLEYDLRGFPYTRTINTKTAEIAQAQTTLATLQNELKTTQAQYEQEKEQCKTRIMTLNQAFVSPPKQNTSKHKGYKCDRFSKAIFAEPTLKILCVE